MTGWMTGQRCSVPVTTTRTVEEVVADLWAASAPVDERVGAEDGGEGKA